MSPVKGSVGRDRYWPAVVGYVLALLAVQPFLGYGVDWWKETLGETSLEVTAYVAVAVGAGAILAVAARVAARTRAVERLWLVVALALYGAGTMTAGAPQERLHYLGYGLMAAMFYVGLRDHTASLTVSRHAFAGALVGGSAIGLLDECLQIAWPRRYFDWKDVGMNALAVLLGLLVTIPAYRAAGRRD